MVYYPIIYTRTFQCDYFAKFHVLPEFVRAEWLMPYIRSATTDMNQANKTIKKVVITDTEVCVFGMITYARDVVDLNLLNCTTDSQVRQVYGFYGIAVQIDENTETDSIPEFTKEVISKMYEKYIAPVWMDTTSKTQIPEEISLLNKPLSNTEVEAEYLWNNSVNVFSEEGNLSELLLLKALNGDTISYCSSINDYKELKKSPFNYIVTSENNIGRLKKELPVIKEVPAPEQTAPVFQETEKIVPHEEYAPTPSEKFTDSVENSDGSKKNQHMEEDSDISQKSIQEEIEDVLKKYYSSALAVFITAIVTVSLIGSLAKFFENARNKSSLLEKIKEEIKDAVTDAFTEKEKNDKAKEDTNKSGGTMNA